MQWLKVYSVDSRPSKGTFHSREDAVTEIFEYIEIYYNLDSINEGIPVLITKRHNLLK